MKILTTSLIAPLLLAVFANALQGINEESNDIASSVAVFSDHDDAPETLSSCSNTIPNWVDRLQSNCSWYAKFKALRCAEAQYLAPRRSPPATVVCCACGGGDNPNEPIRPITDGFYYVQSKRTQTYIGLRNDGVVTSFLGQVPRTAIQIVGVGDDASRFSLRFFTGELLSFSRPQNQFVTWNGGVRPTETFKYLDVPANVNPRPGVAWKRGDVFLAVSGGVRPVSSEAIDGATFSLIKIRDEAELERIKLAHIKLAQEDKNESTSSY